MIRGADLIVYSNNDEEITISLSPVQLQTVCKVLGIKYSEIGEVSCYSDQGLLKLMEKTIDNWVEM